MFHTSTQRKYWVFKSEKELADIRDELNASYRQRFKDTYPAKKDASFLSVDEEKALADYYQGVLIDVCGKFQPPIPQVVAATAVAYLKRFYLKVSVMDHPPKEMFLVCLYMACKVEEYNISVDTFLQILPVERREKAKDFIIGHELLLMQYLDFHLTVHNAYRPLEGFLIDLKTTETAAGKPEAWRPRMDEFLRVALAKDVCLLFPPSQIALAALYNASQTDTSRYISDSFGGKADAITAQCQTIIDSVLSSESYAFSKEQVKQIEVKLKGCRNPENNPDSKMFKRKKLDREQVTEDS